MNTNRNLNRLKAKFDVLMHVTGTNLAQICRKLVKSIENEAFEHQYVSREPVHIPTVGGGRGRSTSAGGATIESIESIGYSARAIVDAETRAPCPLGRNSRICFASGSPSRSIGSSRADEVARASDERSRPTRSDDHGTSRGFRRARRGRGEQQQLLMK